MHATLRTNFRDSRGRVVWTMDTLISSPPDEVEIVVEHFEIDGYAMLKLDIDVATD